jgi:hypothetical protein
MTRMYRRETSSLAFNIAEFLLNLLPLQVPPSKAALECYIRSHFTPVADAYRFSCHEGILQIGNNTKYVET